jgi:hypothetical protein
MVSQGVEFSLETRHLADVGAHFFVDIFYAPVNVMELLCDVAEIPDSTRRRYNPLGPLKSLSPSRPLGSLYSGFQAPLVAQEFHVLPFTLLASCSSSSSHSSPKRALYAQVDCAGDMVNWIKIFVRERYVASDERT